ncbi:MAG: hypothetical protein R3C39_12060 [Dehalococcoidia bacterium]
MVTQRCEFCSQRPIEEVAILRWVGEDRERLTVWLCDRHLRRIQRAGANGWEHKGRFHKVGFW